VDRVKWTKLAQILQGTGIDAAERRGRSKLYMNQDVKVRLDRGQTRSVKTGRGVRQGCCLSQILFKLNSEYLIKVAHEELETSQLGGPVILTVKCADGLALLTKEETVTQGMINRLINVGRCYGMEMNVGKLR
jgi:hypothetical protein